MAGPNGSANGNGEVAERGPASTVFDRASKDIGVIEGLGHVILREAALTDIWPYLGVGDAQSFGLRILAASLEIDGQRIGYEQLAQMGMRHMKALQSLLPDVRALNSLDVPDDEPDPDEGSEKNADVAGAVSGQAASPSGTDS